MKRGKRGGWKRGREWGLHQMSVVETHKLPTFKHLHLKGEHIYIPLILKKKKNRKQTCLAEIKPRNTTKTPPQTKKVHRELSFPCFHSEIWLQSVICFAPQDGTERWTKPSLLSLLDPILWEGVGRPMGYGWINSWLLGRMSDHALSILQDSTEPPGAASAVKRGAESTKHREPECDRGKGTGPCAFS